MWGCMRGEERFGGLGLMEDRTQTLCAPKPLNCEPVSAAAARTSPPSQLHRPEILAAACYESFVQTHYIQCCAISRTAQQESPQPLNRLNPKVGY